MNMLRANALFIVLVIALVIGVLCTSLIIGGYYHRIQIQKTVLYKRLALNAQSGCTLLLAENNFFEENQTTTLDLYGSGKDSLLIEKRNWGILKAGIVTAFSGKNKITHTFLYGEKPGGIFSPALYVCNSTSKPLYLSGKTRIRGTCYLPESGIKTAFIEGQPFTGSTLVDGEIRYSTPNLPLLFTDIRQEAAHIRETDEAEHIPDQDTLFNSFKDKPFLVRYETLRWKYIRGNIILTSDHMIILDEHISLEDVIVTAPAVKIRKGFRGTIQVFATDSIILEPEARLSYPSAIILLPGDTRNNKIWIAEKSSLDGMIIVSCKPGYSDYTLVQIDKEAEVKGQVYVDGLLQLQGTIYGHAFCRKVYLKTPSAVYENYLLNATIDQSDLSPDFVGTFVMGTGNQGDIIKWVK